MAPVSPTAPRFLIHPSADSPPLRWRLSTGRLCGGRDSAAQGRVALRWGPVRGGIAAKAPPPRRGRFCGVLGKCLAHPAYRREKRRNEGAAPAGAGSRILPAIANEAQRAALPFGPVGKGGVFSARVKTAAAAGGKIARSVAIFVLTPLRKHNILWSARPPNTSSENSPLTANKNSYNMRVEQVLQPPLIQPTPPQGDLDPKGCYCRYAVAERTDFFCPKKAAGQRRPNGVHIGPRVPTVRGGVLPARRGETEASIQAVADKVACKLQGLSRSAERHRRRNIGGLRARKGGGIIRCGAAGRSAGTPPTSGLTPSGTAPYGGRLPPVKGGPIPVDTHHRWQHSRDHKQDATP